MIDPKAPDAAAQMVRTLVTRMEADGVTLIRKAGDVFMDDIAAFLEKTGTMNAVDFKEGTFTTINRTIYYPGGVFGELWQTPAGYVYDQDTQVELLLHEYTHTLQPAAQGGELAYDLGYLLHQIDLVHDESEARVAQVWWRWRREGRILDTRQLAAQLAGYRVDDETALAHAKTILDLCAETIAAGILPNAACEFSDAWIRDEVPWILGHTW